MVYIGQRNIWDKQEPFGLHLKDRRQHVHIIGKSGTGKSSLLHNLILQDIAAGRGVGLIDPHGDLASGLLDHIPPERSDDLVYFDPSDSEYPIGLNLLQNVPPDSRHVVASGLVGAFRGIWRDFWGPRTEYILYATIAALLDCQNTSILGIPRMLSDEGYREWVVKHVKDPVVRLFWTNEFAKYDERFMRDAIAPIQNKVGQVLLAPPIRNIFGQVRSRISPRFMIDNHRIFIASLSKGQLGEDKANLLGALLVAQFQLAAMSRADLPEEERPDFFLFIDEFHNFTTDAFATLLAESRKYHFSLTLSHQHIAQVAPVVRDAILGNVGSHIAFRVGSTDAHTLAQEYGGSHSAAQFTNLANHEVCVKLLENGEQLQPFIARTYPPMQDKHGRRDLLIQRSRQKYGTRRSVVEDRFRRWMRS